MAAASAIRPATIDVIVPPAHAARTESSGSRATQGLSTADRRPPIWSIARPSVRRDGAQDRKGLRRQGCPLARAGLARQPRPAPAHWRDLALLDDDLPALARQGRRDPRSRRPAEAPVRLASRHAP